MQIDKITAAQADEQGSWMATMITSGNTIYILLSYAADWSHSLEF